METFGRKQITKLLKNVEVEKLGDGFRISGLDARALHAALEAAGATPATLSKGTFTITNHDLRKADDYVKMEMDSAASTSRGRYFD